MVGANDLEAAKKFYDATFQAIGGKPAIQDEKGRLIYMYNGGLFLVGAPIDGEPATVGNGCTIGFAMEGPEQAKAWHDAGVAAGGTSIEDPPGVREGSFGPLYLAYLRDPSGNKLCALHRVV
jgi:predicted enzyme related to lactoylglutathione lyase